MTPEFRARVVHCARAVAAGYVHRPSHAFTPHGARLAVKILNAPDGDLVFTDLAMRLDPGESAAGPATDGELTHALEAVWDAVAADFDPGVDRTD